MNKKRYSSIDFLRFFLACLIVAIHNPYGMTDFMPLDAILRTAVPLFFMVSGFFNVYDSKEKAIAKNKAGIKRIFFMALGANIVYLFWGFYVNRFDNTEYINRITSKRGIVDAILFNDTPVKAHLWFLSALLMCYIMSYLVAKFNIGNKIYILIFTGLIVMTLSELDNLILHRDIYNIYYRNFWFFGSSYFLIGKWIRENEEKVVGKIKPVLGIILSVVFYILTIIEIHFTGRNEAYTLLLVPELILFITMVEYPNIGKDSVVEKWGRDYSLPLYIFHPIVCDIITVYVYNYHLNTKIMSIIIVPLTVAIMLILIKIYYSLKRRLRRAPSPK